MVVYEMVAYKRWSLTEVVALRELTVFGAPAMR